MITLFYLVCALMIIGGVVSIGFGIYCSNETEHLWRGIRFSLCGFVLTVAGLAAGIDHFTHTTNWISHYLTLPGLLTLVGIVLFTLGAIEDRPGHETLGWIAGLTNIGIALAVVFGAWSLELLLSRSLRHDALLTGIIRAGLAALGGHTLYVMKARKVPKDEVSKYWQTGVGALVMLVSLIYMFCLVVPDIWATLARVWHGIFP